MIITEEERKDGTDSEGSGNNIMDEDSDEEDSNMIPDEKPDGDSSAVDNIGDTTANE